MNLEERARQKKLYRKKNSGRVPGWSPHRNWVTGWANRHAPGPDGERFPPIFFPVRPYWVSRTTGARCWVDLSGTVIVLDERSEGTDS